MAALAGLLLLAACSTAQAAGAMRCDGRIVDEGDLAASVLGACGEPAYRDPWLTRGRNQQYFADLEDWYYNFGANQLLRVVRLRNGRVASIDTDGYGYDMRPQPPCAPLDITPGLSKFRLLLYCGEPATRKALTVLRPLQRERGFGDGVIYQGQITRDPRYLEQVYREQWVYNFGSDFLLRIVTLENGRVSDVQNGDRGFD